MTTHAPEGNVTACHAGEDLHQPIYRPDHFHGTNQAVPPQIHFKTYLSSPAYQRKTRWLLRHSAYFKIGPGRLFENRLAGNLGQCMIFLNQLEGERAGFAAADDPTINLDHRHDFRTGPGQETFIGVE